MVILVGLVLARGAWGGDYSNNYTVPGSASQQGTDLLEKGFPNQSTYVGQLVFHSPSGKTLQPEESTVNQAVTNVSKLRRTC